MNLLEFDTFSFSHSFTKPVQSLDPSCKATNFSQNHEKNFMLQFLQRMWKSSFFLRMFGWKDKKTSDKTVIFLCFDRLRISVCLLQSCLKEVVKLLLFCFLQISLLLFSRNKLYDGLRFFRYFPSFFSFLVVSF